MPNVRFLHNKDDTRSTKYSTKTAYPWATASKMLIDTPRYLGYLAACFTSAGGHIHRGTVQHIYQAVGSTLYGERAVLKTPHAAAVCTGIGMWFLGGVEDKTVYPIRG